MKAGAYPAFISYPPKAAYGRSIAKSKIYEHGGTNSRLKELFVRQVDQIVWQYKLAPETINLPGRPGVPEIQVFSVLAKTKDLEHDVLHCIDKAVQYPIIFEVVHGDRIRVSACYKRPNESDVARWVLSEYFTTDWISSDEIRAPMPQALDLASLYEQLLYRLIPFKARPQEPLKELVDRADLVRTIQREIERIEARLVREAQFNRKVEINAALRRLKSECEKLTN